MSAERHHALCDKSPTLLHFHIIESPSGGVRRAVADVFEADVPFAVVLWQLDIARRNEV